MNAPTTAMPAMIPPPRELLSPTLEPVVAIWESMTPCLTHSPKVQPLSDNPDDPNTLCRTLCLKLHEAVPFAATGSQEIVRASLSPLIVLVKFNDPAPQKVVPGRQVHRRPEHDQVAPLDPETVCEHPPAVQ